MLVRLDAGSYNLPQERVLTVVQRIVKHEKAPALLQLINC